MVRAPRYPWCYIRAKWSKEKQSAATALRAQQQRGGPRENEFKYLDLQRKEGVGVLEGLWRALHISRVSSVATRNQRSCTETGTICCFALLCDLAHACPSSGLNYAPSYSTSAPKTVGWLHAVKRKIWLSLFPNGRTAGTVPFLCPSATGLLGSFQSPIAFLLSQLKGCQVPRDLSTPALSYRSRGKESASLLHPFFGGQPCLFSVPAATRK